VFPTNNHAIPFTPRYFALDYRQRAVTNTTSSVNTMLGIDAADGEGVVPGGTNSPAFVELVHDLHVLTVLAVDAKLRVPCETCVSRSEAAALVVAASSAWMLKLAFTPEEVDDCSSCIRRPLVVTDVDESSERVMSWKLLESNPSWLARSEISDALICA